MNIFVNDLLRRIVPFSTVQPDADSPPATFRTTLHGAQTDAEHPAERAHAFAALILMEYLFFDFLGIMLHLFHPCHFPSPFKAKSSYAVLYHIEAFLSLSVFTSAVYLPVWVFILFRLLYRNWYIFGQMVYDLYNIIKEAR